MHPAGGKTKTFGLPSEYAITNPLPFAEEAVRIINEHTRAHAIAQHG